LWLAAGADGFLQGDDLHSSVADFAEEAVEDGAAEEDVEA
jgi:hypothetical protein